MPNFLRPFWTLIIAASFLELVLVNMKNSRPSDKVVAFWVSQDREFVQNMVFRYTNNFQLDINWKKVRLVLWGPSIKLLALDRELQENLEDLRKNGIEVQACKSSVHTNGVSEDLVTLGIEVVSMSDPIAEYKKANWSIVFF